ncbi:MAG TPA: DUF104 domain-containing protein [Archaeoglobaceae archaeon]|nr:DUF104 domain-containing protein [Archaeoglobaceae archaeon]
MAKIIEAIYEKGVFKPLQKVVLKEGEKVRLRIEKEKGLVELIEKLSEKFKDVKEDPLEVLLEMRKRSWD